MCRREERVYGLIVTCRGVASASKARPAADADAILRAVVGLRPDDPKKDMDLSELARTRRLKGRCRTGGSGPWHVDGAETATCFGAPSESTPGGLYDPDGYRLTIPWGSRREASRLRTRPRMEKAPSNPSPSYPGAGLLLEQKGAGDEAGELQKQVLGRVAEGGAADDAGEGDVAGRGAVLPGLEAAGDGVVDAQPPVQSRDLRFLLLIEDEEGVAAVGPDGGVDAGDEAAKRRLLHGALRVCVSGKAHIDDLDPSTVRPIVLNESQAHFAGSPPTSSRGTCTPCVSLTAEAWRLPWASSIRRALQLRTVGGDAVAVAQPEPPVADLAEEVVPALRVHAEGGTDVAAASLGRGDVVEPHGSPPRGVFRRQGG